MVTLSAFLYIYLLGGVTFIPLVICALFCHAYFLLPISHSEEPTVSEPNTSHNGLEKEGIGERELAGLPPEIQVRPHERDVAAGYFAVSREYVPRGVNGKPPERTTPAGEVVAVESPSVYQSMYRSIFDRGKVQGPTLEASNGNLKATKKARNVFYIVLRLGHLMLYDDASQLEVRHVISLGLYDIDVYGGGEEIPEGELWVKRNCIRLTRRETSESQPQDSKPFFLFSDNCSEKEDFYHAMLQNQGRASEDPQHAHTPLRFDASHIVKLVQQLHASEEDLQTRWLNALVGRLFLSLYKTSELHSLIHTKITKKISRVPKPAFIEEIQVKKIDMGDSAPLFTSPKLKELTLDGDLTVEADVKYRGNFRLEIAAVALLDLGPRFKPRRIDLLLAGICKSLEGHVLIRIKPPPSNRIWISFETMPKLELSIEPIVSSRQITYGLILRAIESRIREVIGETLVLPNWDDIPFSDTSQKAVRGGLWMQQSVLQALSSTIVSKLVDSEKAEALEEANAEQVLFGAKAKAMSTPTLIGRRRTSTGSHTSAVTINSLNDSPAVGESSGFEVHNGASKHKGMRSSSFTTVASPVVSVDPAVVEAIREQSSVIQQDAAATIKDISARSHSASPAESPVGTPPKLEEGSATMGTTASQSQATTEPPSRQMTDPTWDKTKPEPENSPVDRKTVPIAGNRKRPSVAASAVAVTAAARKWGFDLVTRNSSSASAASDQEDKDNDVTETQRGSSIDLGSPNNPIGRGRPLPPPGTPLPRPSAPGKAGWTVSLGSLTRRKPVSGSTPQRDTSTSDGPPTSTAETQDQSGSPPPPPLPRRPRTNTQTQESTPNATSSPIAIPNSPQPRRRHDKARSSSKPDTTPPDEVLVIQAPEEEGEGESATSSLNSDQIPQHYGSVEGSDRSRAAVDEHDGSMNVTEHGSMTEPDGVNRDEKEMDRDSLKMLEALSP